MGSLQTPRYGNDGSTQHVMSLPLSTARAHVAIDHKAPIDAAHVGRRAVHGKERPEPQIARLHFTGHDGRGVETGAPQLFILGMTRTAPFSSVRGSIASPVVTVLSI